MHGQGGIGKTVLAAAAARDPVVRAHFPDGLFWVTAGEQPDLAGLQAGLLSRLGVAGAAPRSATEGAGLLRQALAGRQVLLVVDDVWSAAAAQAFRVTGPRGRVLYTTRDPAVLAAVGAVAERVDVLSASAARQLLARSAGLPAGALPAGEVDRVLAATGRVALAVALVGAAVRGGASWAEVAGELDRGGETFLDHPYANTFKALQVATAALDPGLAFAYFSLAVYPPDTRIPVAAVARYWGQLRGSSPGQVHTDLRTLADRELLILDRDEIAFHDLQHSYLLLQAGQPGAAARRPARRLPGPASRRGRMVAAAGRGALHLGPSAVPPARRRGPRRGRQHADRPGLSGQADRAGRAARRGDRPR